jgi:adenosylhomocysteine nucleosidase
MKGEVRSAKREPETLVCFALKEEAAPFRGIAARRPDVQILITGIGRKNAERSLRTFLTAHSPQLVLTCGFAGGLNPNLAVGTVIFETAESRLAERLLAAAAKPAKFHCADRIAATATEKAELRQRSGADAVEMESAAIQSVCRERGLPCATVRVILDSANEDLPLDFNQLGKADYRMDYGKLAWAIVKSPRKISSLLRLQAQCRHAGILLASILWNVLGA